MFPELDPVDKANDILRITPLGAGQEVGRSCIIVEYKSKKIMLDCGIHPAYQGILSLPYFDYIDPAEIDIIFVSHFHLDHCGALPWFLNKTFFKGRVFMTHATKAIYNGTRLNQSLFSERDLENTLDRIEVVHFHQEVEVNGIQFTCYHAGHVLGACMFLIEIAGVKVLYTGDFSRETDRHLVSAEIPNVKPEVLIMESTYAGSSRKSFYEYVKCYTDAVKNIVTRGGRCLIPAFALGRAQEQLLILDEFWEENIKELGHIPIYYASTLAKKCLSVYQTYSSAMNEKMQEQGMDEFNDNGPCVILASPGMLQDGFSRDLFELWCSDPKNGVIIAGYSVEGTLAKELISEPVQVMSINGRPLSRKCSIGWILKILDYISFSAHADYNEFKELVDGISPKNIVLVHGESSEMTRLKNSLMRDLAEKNVENVQIYTPKNTHSQDLYFKGELIAKVYGKLVPDQVEENETLNGVILKSGFSYKILSHDELEVHSDLKTTKVKQKLKIPFPVDDKIFNTFVHNLSILAGQNINVESKMIQFENVDIVRRNNCIVLMWTSDIKTDVVADTIIAIIQETVRTQEIILNIDNYEPAKNRSLIQLVENKYGRENIAEDDDLIHVIIGQEDKATINRHTLSVACENSTYREQIEREIFHYKIAIDAFCRCKCH